MEVPLEIGVVDELDTKFVSFNNTNVAFDEPLPKFSSPRRDSTASGASTKSVGFSENEELSNSPNTSRSNTPGGILKSILISNLEEEPDEYIPRPAVRPKAAVTVRRAVKRYGRREKCVLNNFGMTVQRGTIYSLLGASGCGKTTALTCIIGIRNLESGEISVFGAKPGTAESGVPGRRVGYMPQEIALYQDFTIDETLRYYGTLFGMDSEDVKASRDSLMSVLNLPDETRRVGALSSGEERRVSLAVSLIHSPELLILDEPTVGVDALLRETIWNHLVNLAKNEDTTVIITTHYIQEASRSNMIGLMRNGRLLAENSPEILMKEHNAFLLEEIVLKLCRIDKLDENNLKTEKLSDEEKHQQVAFVAPYDKRRFSGVRKLSMFQMEQLKLKSSGKLSNSLSRIKALTMKNIFIMLRNLLLVLFTILIPSAIVIIICLGIGSDPKPMWMGVVDHESNSSNCLPPSFAAAWGSIKGVSTPDDTDECYIENLSCKYLEHLPEDVINLIEYDNEDSARDAIRAGKIWGFISFPEGFSESVYVRASNGSTIDDAALDNSFISYQLDMTSKQIAGVLKRILNDGYRNFIRQLLDDCGLNTKLAEYPVKALKPIYGTDDTNSNFEYITVSLMLGLLFFFPLCSSSTHYLFDKKQGTLTRARVAGVHTWEIMLAFFITEGIVLFIQSGLTLLVITELFGIVIQGSTILAFCLIVCVGLAGVSMGFLIASFCNEEVDAMMFAMAAFFPNAILSGLIWPIEGMATVLQFVSYLLPCTFAAESMRSIVSRGWDFTHIKVWSGFLSIIAWICAYWIISIGLHKIILTKK